MSIKAFHFLNPHRATGLFALAVVVFTVSLYFIFDLYLDSVGKEIGSSWIQSEAVNIQEGNLLSAITKNQRVLLSSQFIKGVKLVDASISPVQSMIEFGEPFTPSFPSELEQGKIGSSVTGFLSRQVYYRIPERPQLVLCFTNQSNFLTKAFLMAVAAFIAMITFFFTSIRSIEARRIEAESKNRILLGEVAARVAHDIRSPLNTLNAVLETIDDLPPNSKKLLTTAIQRIREIGLGIADHSLLAFRESSSFNSIISVDEKSIGATLLLTLIEDLIEEKRLQYPSRANDLRLNLSPGAHSIFASINTNEFKRSLSNLIDNSIEASANGSPITLSLNQDHKWTTITLSDQGKGIPGNVLRKVGDRGFSFGKDGGTGIGVHFAKRAFNSWGGKLNIESAPGQGTTVQIQLPATSAPTWFSNQLDLKDYSTVVIIDDDATIHASWKDRISSVRPEMMIEHFFDPESASSWINQNRMSLEKSLLLTDYNLNSPSGTGLSILERFGRTNISAIMVTNAFDDKGLQERCEQLNIKILPKSLIGFTLMEVR